MFEIAHDTVVFVVGMTAIFASIGVVVCASPIYCALYLIGNMLCLAILFLMYNAEFIAIVQIIVYAGANGAGKSTPRAGGTDAVEVEMDPDRIARRINPADPRAVDFVAGKEALRLFDQTVAEGRSPSLETTLTGRTVLARMQAARDAGYDVALRYVGVDGAETNIRRIAARAAAGGHWIEPDVVRRRVAGSLEDPPAAIAVAHRAVLLDNSGLVHKRVLDVERGRVLHQAPDPPAWLVERLPRIAAELERVARRSRPTQTPPARR